MGDLLSRQGGGGGGASSETLSERWTQSPVAISQTNVDLSASVSVAFDTIKPRAAGSIIGLRWRLLTSTSAGTLTVRPTVNGVEVANLSGVSTNGSNADGGEETQDEGLDEYDDDDTIGVSVTTDGTFAPTSNVLEVELIIKSS